MITLPNSSILKIALAYKDNLGFEEMMDFYQHASPEEQKELELLLDEEKYDEALAMIESETGVELESMEDDDPYRIVTCPRCNGEGEVSADYNDHPNNPNTKRCPQCFGKGEVSYNDIE